MTNQVIPQSVEKNVKEHESSVHLATSEVGGSCLKTTVHYDKDSRTLMLQDTTLERAPTQLEQLFSHFKVDKLSKSEILFQLVYLVALETGFGEKSAFARCESMLNFSYVITSFFDWHNVQCFVQQKPKFSSDKNGTQFSMQLRNIVSDKILINSGIDMNTVCSNMSAVVTGDLMIVSLVPVHCDEESQQHSERSICLTIPRFIVGTVNKKTKLHECLRNMEDFEIQLRDKIFVPVRNYQFSLLEFDSFPSLLGLPSEAYDIIIGNLNDKQFCSLAQVNKLMNNIIINSKQYTQRLIEKEKPFSRNTSKISNSSIFDLDTFY